MNITKIITIVALGLLLMNCSGKTIDEDGFVTDFSRNIDSLAKYTNIEKYKPVNVMWKEVLHGGKSDRMTVPGPTDYKLEAYLQFDRSTADKLKNDYNINSDSNNIISIEEFWFEWLPKDMLFKNKLDSSKIDTADPFFKSPLLNGNYIFINTNTILLELYTK